MRVALVPLVAAIIIEKLGKVHMTSSLPSVGTSLFNEIEQVREKSLPTDSADVGEDNSTCIGAPTKTQPIIANSTINIA